MLPPTRVMLAACVLLCLVHSASTRDLHPNDITPAMLLAKFAYSINPHNIPPEVWTDGLPAAMQRPVLADDRLGAYVFKASCGRIWVTFRGMMLASAWASGTWMAPEVLLLSTMFESSVHLSLIHI
eukprot:TRINITY_DN52093_c0_g1_i1.p1 TRINITY_DN52093_c0_g1~~TRINITY_DN52093_c0_g1_i1.p1  ORF type:complete len:126 (-),score=22.29 TRINITY_DN52093_c0_g1_i1:56-433(-)